MRISITVDVKLFSSLMVRRSAVQSLCMQASKLMLIIKKMIKECVKKEQEYRRGENFTELGRHKYIKYRYKRMVRMTRRPRRTRPRRSTNAYHTLMKEDSPYYQCPENIRCLFKIYEEDHQIELESFKNHFPLRKSPTDYCTRRVDADLGQKGYRCVDCAKEPYRSVTLCEECFVKEHHEGHQYVEQDNDTLCACGRMWMMKENFCKQHGKHQEVEIREEDQKEFLDFFGWLWSIVFYLCENSPNSKLQSTLKQNLSSVLEALAQGSSYYIQLVSQLIITPLQKIPLLEEHQSIIKYFFHEDFGVRLVEHLCGDDGFRLKLAKELQKWKQETGNSTPYQFSDLEEEIISNGQILKRLGEEDFYLTQMGHKYVQFAKKGEEGSKTLLSDFVAVHSEKKEDNRQYIQFLVDNFTLHHPNVYEENVLMFMIQKALMYLEDMKKQQQDQRNCSGSELNQEEEGDNDQENDEESQQQQEGQICQEYQQSQQEKNQNASFVLSEEKKEEGIQNEEKENESQECTSEDYTLRKVVSFLTEKLIDIIGEKIQNPQSIAEHLNQKNLCLKRLQTYLKYSITNISEFYESKQQFFLILILTSLSKDDNLIKRFWKRVMDQDTYSIDAIDRIYQILSIIGLWDAIRWKLGNEYSEKGSEIKSEQMNHWWRCYLCEGKEHSQSDLVRLKQNFPFVPQAGQILNKLCKYNQQQSLFQYNSSQLYKNPLQKFPYRTYMGQFTCLYHIQTQFKELYNVPDSCRFQLEIIKKLFTHDSFLTSFKKVWSNTIRNIEGDQYEQQNALEKRIGYLYVILLIVIDNLLNGKNQTIREELQSLIKDKDERFKYEYLAGETGAIDKILGIDLEEKSKKDDEKLKIMIEKGEAKKKKLQQKFKKKNSQMIQKLLSKTKTVHIQEEDDLCIVCHEKGKEMNPLFYLASLKKGKTPSTAIHHKNNKAQTLISTCFHVMHLQCFRQFEKDDNKQFNCPLCSKSINCLLPMNLEEEDERFTEAWQNLLIGIAVLTNNSFWFGGAFGLLFEHCLQSYGLNPLVCISKYNEQKLFRLKGNKFIFSLLQKTYFKSSGQIRNKYDKTLNTIWKQIKLIQSTLAGKVQMILWKFITDKIWQNQICSENKQIRQLQEIMVEEQFAILHQNLELISNHSISVQQNIKPSNPETLSLNLFKLPQKLEKQTQLNELPLQKKCQACEKGQKQNFCLLCKRTFCSRCSYENQLHLEMHNNHFLVLQVESGRLVRYFNETTWTDDIYFNYFKQRFYDFNEEERTRQIFFLDKKKYQKVLTEFIAN